LYVRDVMVRIVLFQLQTYLQHSVSRHIWQHCAK
jgi:hypothetical protein